ETLHYKDGVWRVGLGKVIDINCKRIKNSNYIDIKV
ncbi:hypothetical protein LCGC14_3129630, partial [marine sediment metagenome]